MFVGANNRDCVNDLAGKKNSISRNSFIAEYRGWTPLTADANYKLSNKIKKYSYGPESAGVSLDWDHPYGYYLISAHYSCSILDPGASFASMDRVARAHPMFLWTLKIKIQIISKLRAPFLLNQPQFCDPRPFIPLLLLCWQRGQHAHVSSSHWTGF